MKDILTIPQRKFGLVIGVVVLSFISLWTGTLPADVLGTIVTWVSGLYFGANVIQKGVTK